MQMCTVHLEEGKTLCHKVAETFADDMMMMVVAMTIQVLSSI
jgi:hypothetical protein